MAPLPAPILFAIDTAGERCTLALSGPSGLAWRGGDAGRTRLEDVFPMIEGLFADCGLRPADCAAFAFASGPGSFTGLRVACTIVQGLALGAGRPVIGVGHFDVLLRAALESGMPAAAGMRVLLLLDARMDQAYWSVHEAGEAGWRCIGAPVVGGRAQLQQSIEQWRPALCAGDAAWIRRYIGAMDMAPRDAAVDAGVLARVACERFAAGAGIAPQQARPLYVRDQVARTVAQRREAGN
jgi:tRNA threonylcarbamoyladenosine biosynthesis protein TsaB